MGLVKWIKELFDEDEREQATEESYNRLHSYSESDLRKPMHFTVNCQAKYKFMLDEIVKMRKEEKLPDKACTKSAIVSEALEHLFCETILEKLERKD